MKKLRLRPFLDVYIEIPYLFIRSSIMKEVMERGEITYIQLEIKFIKWTWSIRLWNTIYPVDENKTSLIDRFVSWFKNIRKKEVLTDRELEALVKGYRMKIQEHISMFSRVARIIDPTIPSTKAVSPETVLMLVERKMLEHRTMTNQWRVK